MPDEDKTFGGLFSFGFENLMTSRAHTLYVRIVSESEPRELYCELRTDATSSPVVRLRLEGIIRG